MMTSSTPWQPITKPIAVWNKQLNTDFKDFFLALSKATIDGVVGKWDDAASNAVDALEAVGLTHDAGQIAWLLIRRALTRATFDLIQEHVSQLQANAPKNPKAFEKAVDDSLENVEMTIDAAFFEHPQDLPVVTTFQIPFKQWLRAHGFVEAQADTLVARLPTYFVYALNHEWRRKPEAYKLVKEALETPFTRAGEREQNWNYYYAWLQKQIHESVFNETFSLHQIYIPLRAYYEREKKADRDFPKKKMVRVVVDLAQELDKWVHQANPQDAIRVISGGPGAGKSSFACMYAAHQTSNPHLRVLFIPLHHFDPKGDLISSVGEFVRYATQLSHNPLDRDNGDKRLLIIFDGLDELAMQGKMGAETARDFVDEVDRTVSRLNSRELRLQVLLTGRDVVIQTNASKFRQEAQHLHVMPYFLSETESEEQEYFDPSDLLQHDQRHSWWERYGIAIGKNYEQIPETLQRDDLDEITNQPLLNYLVALSYIRGVVDFSLQVNLNEIYADLLKAVYERKYAQGRQHPTINELSFDHFGRILEEIALATWHNDGRTATFSEVQKHCEAAGLSKLLDSFRQGAELGAVRLFTAFYFRQHDAHRDGEPTFEFTHKSFGEYLTARRIVRALERIHKQRQEHKSDLESGWDERMALKHWAELYQDTPFMTQALFRFVQSEIALKNKQMVAAWQKLLCYLISWMLQYGMPMELLNPRPSYYKETLSALRAEEALLAVAYACACVTEQINTIPRFQEIPTAAGAWWERLLGERDRTEDILTLSCLGYFDLRYCTLAGRNLASANLHHANLAGADLMEVNLTETNLAISKLVIIRLTNANLRMANLIEVDLRGANLIEANLIEADLTGADLTGADLIGADLTQANLTGAYLTGANLTGADLTQANLTGAYLTQANLTGAYLTEANLTQGSLINYYQWKEVTLPDGTEWASDTDMARFTDPEHPNFWQPSND